MSPVKINFAAVEKLKVVRNIAWRIVCAFFPVFVKPDDAFAKIYLSDNEYQLYMQMDKRDRDHACQVTETLLDEVPAAPDYLIKAAFLHDLGKTSAKYNPLERILVHFYAPSNIAREPRLKGLHGAWQRRRHHGYYGAEKLREAGCCEKIALVVEHHHETGLLKDAALLKTIEERF